ncbi:MAG: hypothetical protein J5546_11030 [Lachnospiraceae bacterium]|nr:hypothetical protein [Lachnospiraceae bacterium]
MSEKKTGQAERLFEAMSGVDPELLARSEKKKKVVSFQKYAKAMKVMAACLALIVVGGTCWVTLQNGGSQKASDATAQMSATRDNGEKGKRINSLKGDVAEAAQSTSEAGKQYDSMACDNEAANYYEADDEPREVASAIEASNDDGKEVSKGVTSDSATATLQEEYFLKISKQVDPSMLISYSAKASIEEYGKRSEQSVTKSFSTAIYSWLDGLELVPTEDVIFGDYVCVQLIDAEGNVTKEIRVHDSYLQKTDLVGTFEIVDEEYDYDELRAALEAAMQAEE